MSIDQQWRVMEELVREGGERVKMAARGGS
jgi:hypothetical protein